jgi:ribonuclease D
MLQYELITADRDLGRLVERLRSENPVRVAMDIEGENNLHAYGIRVALIQLYDGKRAFLVDPLGIKDKSLLRELLEESGWLKVMFDATNDLLAFQHDLGIRPAPLLDAAVAAQVLGLKGGLGALTGRSESPSAKDKFQRANWMRRPLSPDLLQYAVSDVEDLLSLADRLTTELAARGLLFEFLKRNWERQSKLRTWDPLPNYVRIPGYQRMSAADRRFARVLWYAREYYARRHDMSPENVATKSVMVRLIQAGTREPSEIARVLNDRGGRFHVDARSFTARLAEAERDAPPEG